MRPASALCILASVSVSLAACQRGRPYRPTGARPAPTASAALSRELSRAAEARALVRTEISRSFALPAHLGERRCPDAKLDALPEGERELPLAVSDSRYQGRSVLPLPVKRHLVDPDPSLLEAELVGIDHSGSQDSAVDAIQWLASRRYVAVFHILDFARARRFHRIGHRHAEWDAGRILAWLVIHDVASGKALCQTRLAVAGDAHGAPLSVRLRSRTRDRLTEQLGQRLRRAARPALARLSSVLFLRGDARAPGVAAR
jgi:hypothetical protein